MDKQECSNEMIQISFTLTRGSEFEYSIENTTTLKLLKQSFVIHCGPIRLEELVFAVRSQSKVIELLVKEDLRKLINF